MTEKDISALLRKADELKALFILGQRVIPFLEEIFLFVKDIKPMLDEINVSIEENLKKMPNASKQLSKVTEATEMATNEIMDIVDGLVYKSDIISNNLKRITEIDTQRNTSPVKILELINKAVKEDTDIQELMPQLTTTIDDMRSGSGSEYNELVDGTQEILQSIQMDSSSIMMSLQVQDITSQQIAAVNHLLETIQSKLNTIMKKFQASDISSYINAQEPVGYDTKTNVTKMHRDIAFDPEAVESLSTKETRQGEVDKMIKDAEDNGLESMEDSAASPDDIDALFNAANGSDTEETEVQDSPAPDDNDDSNNKDVSDGDEQISQDDIDALFG